MLRLGVESLACSTFENRAKARKRTEMNMDTDREIELHGSAYILFLEEISTSSVKLIKGDSELLVPSI
jgi:hypothetical protein